MNKLFPAVLLVVVLLSGCSEQQPAIQPLSAQGVVLAFGDSLTAGTGVNVEKSFPWVLKKLINRNVINAGVPGEISQDGMRRLPGLLEKYQPELVILTHGGNDLLRKLDKDRLANNIRAMISDTKRQGISVILVAIPRPGLFLSSDEIYKKAAIDYNIPIENKIMSDVLSETALKSDAIHPNAEGYRLIAESIYELMRQTGAIQ